MRGKKAKALRRFIDRGQKIAEAKYGRRTDNGQIIRTDDKHQELKTMKKILSKSGSSTTSKV